MPLFAPRGCIEPDAPDPTGLRLFAGHTDTTAALRWFAGQTVRLFADPVAGSRSGGIKPPRSPRNPRPAPRTPCIATARQPIGDQLSGRGHVIIRGRVERLRWDAAGFLS